MSNKTWGGRFNKPIDKRAAEFNASFAFDYVLFPYDIEGSKVHAKMLAKQNIISEDEAKILCHELERIKMEMNQDNFVPENSAEDIHMYIEQLLIERLGDVGKKLHTGRSRNDQVALDLRLYMKDANEMIKAHLILLIHTLENLSGQYQQDVMPGYTHLQQAQPVSLGAYFGAYVSMFKRDHNRLLDWHNRMNYSPLGAGALAGSGLPLDRHWVSTELGFTGIIENTLDAVSDRDYVIEFCSIGSMIMMHLSRLSEDLIIWATQEFKFLILDDAFATGSSLMPNKKNPDILELIRGKSGRVFGHLMAMLTVMKGLPLAYNKDMQEDKEALFDTVNTLNSCLEIMSPFLNSLRFNLDRMRKQVVQGHLDATTLLEELVLSGIPFREAHHRIGELVKLADSKNISLREAMKK